MVARKGVHRGYFQVIDWGNTLHTRWPGKRRSDSAKWWLGLLWLAVVMSACSDTLLPRTTTEPQPSLDATIDTPGSASLQVGTENVPPTTRGQPPTPARLTGEAIATCPVTLPNGKSPPSDQQAVDFNLGNEEGTLFTIPWPGGKVIFTPKGPGFKSPDGSLAMKWAWYRTIPGDVVIDGTRLDTPAPPMRTLVLRGSEDGYGETGFQPSALVFPTQGCWEVTASVEEASLSFVTLALQITFDPAAPQWLPPEKQLMFADSLVDGWPNAFGFVFRSPDGGEVIVETLEGVHKGRGRFRAPAETYVEVGEARGVCTRGRWDRYGKWESSADAAILEWEAEGFSYRITSTGVGLQCADLLQIALLLRSF